MSSRKTGWVYSQSTGRLTHDGQDVATGYSGAGIGRNNSALQSHPDVGPVPLGRWSVSQPFNSARTGPGAMRLSPLPGTQTYGRSNLEIHGDSIRHPGAASTGCIILPQDVRRQIGHSADRTLRVIP